MSILDPTTSHPLPSHTIQRILHLSPKVHIYQIPPITSTRGFSASPWTSPPHPTAQKIFTARLRIIETSLNSTLKTDIVLEDPDTGDLFAAAPYTSTAVVQQANDSSRFFAIRVQGDGGMKATLGMGFEERGEAIDFGIALGEVRKVLGWDAEGTGGGQGRGGAKGSVQVEQKDFSLKEGETISIQVGSRGRRPAPAADTASSQDDNAALFSIAPPPSAAKAQSSFPASVPLPPMEGKSAQELGFDDGEFGEFQ